MKAVEISAFGKPDVLRLGERPAPVPGAGELLIRVAASGINRPDVLQRTGNYPVPPGASDIPGLEVAGEIVDGDGEAMAAAGLKKGDFQEVRLNTNDMVAALAAKTIDAAVTVEQVVRPACCTPMGV